MKKIIWAILLIPVSSIYAGDKPIIDLTKAKSGNAVFQDTQTLALIHTLINQQKFYPIQVGSRSISAEEFSTLTPAQRSLVNGISHPGFCGRLCGHDYSIATEEDINRLEREMPKDFMKGDKILKATLPGPLCQCCYPKHATTCLEAGTWSWFGIVPLVTGGLTLFLGGIASNCVTPVLIAGGVQCGAGALFQVGVWSAAAIRSVCCYDTKEYTFGENTNTDEEEVDLSSDSD